MKVLITMVSAVAAGTLLAARPQVSGVAMSQSASGDEVTITYSLEDGPAIITVDVLTNVTATSAGASVGDRQLRHLSGDVNCKVEKTSGTIRWRPGFDLAGAATDGATAKAVVRAWSLDDPPDVMVIDLLKRGSDTKYRTHYYPSLEALPGNFPDDQLYKGACLVMKRVHAPKSGRYRFGNFGEPGQWGRAEEKPAVFNLTEDYYLGVFQLTKLQNAYIRNGLQVGQFTVARELRPLENVAWITLRGAVNTSAPTANSVIGYLRARTDYDFDFPSECQWEYACKAGNGEGFWPDGSPMHIDTDGVSIPRAYTSGTSEPTLDRLARYTKSSPASTATTLPQNGGTAIVGSYAPNAWGFYDMLGNVYEYCLDCYKADRSADNGAVLDSTEAGSANVAVRGGCYWEQWYNCRPSRRTSLANSTANNGVYGCRLCCPIAVRSE